ncbi:MAG: division/cell wall cluster transcriptional repressor MraZ [bacterium]|nr:division/cell wall cluster transcriptional repressor MraZ [bacterium]MDD6225438.1 division/cell wall cluster transcriptional repressor MraZ [bacterium]MDY3861779.1 division/cell wall cluster transcriptional repressor MraZ [Ruminococcus sp.]
MFSGTSNHSIDAKGRIVLPQKFREELGETFYVTKGFTDCVQVMSVEQFEHLRRQILQLPADKAMSLQYIMISPAVEVAPNSQGRIPIPQTLRESAGLEKEAVVVGMDSRVEIWDKAKFEEFMRLQQQNLSGALELLRL